MPLKNKSVALTDNCVYNGSQAIHTQALPFGVVFFCAKKLYEYYFIILVQQKKRKLNTLFPNFVNNSGRVHKSWKKLLIKSTFVNKNAPIKAVSCEIG